jgi:uncharacterized protein YbaP (TraB family)
MYLNDILARTFISESGNKDSVDMLLFNFALEHRLDTHGIESVEEQKQILQSIPLELQAKSFVKMMKNIKGHRKALFSLVGDYEKQNIQKLYKKGKKQLGPLRRKMLYERNIIMAERIDKIIRNENAFFAIGSGHLGGNKGVLNLLKRTGISIKPIRI